MIRHLRHIAAWLAPRAAARACPPTPRGLSLEPLEPRLPLSAAGLVDVGMQPEGNLSGKIVYAHGGHGITGSSSGSWSFQRPLLWDMIEDLGNQDQLTFFADELFRAGATVVPLRPIGHQPNEVVLDNDDAGVTFTGAWSNSSAGVYFGSPGDVPYRFASTSTVETATAEYRPNITEAGFYPVYAWTRYGSDRAADQLYRVNHSGGSTEVTVNHRRVGNGLVYLGTYHFEAGAGGSVEISNRSSELGRVVIADMIRFGNGRGDVVEGGTISGRDRTDEAGLYWVEWHVDRSQGIASSEYRTSSDDRTATVSLAPRYSEYMNREADGSLSDRVFVSFHSNAGGSRGVVGLHNTANGGDTPNQEFLARTLGQEVNDDLVAQDSQFEHDWFDRGTNVTYQAGFNYGEINNAYAQNEFDATIVETAFHDDLRDAELMRDADVREAIARATYQGLVKYFNAIDAGATSLTMMPGQVDGVRAVATGAGEAVVSWNLPLVNSYSGGTPTGYRIYGSTNGYGFDGGTYVPGGTTTTHTFTGLDPSEGAYYFKVAAVNASGEGAASEITATIPRAAGADVLIVNGFDRLGRTQNPVQSGAERVRPRQSNSFDYVVQVAEAIDAAAPHLSVDAASNEAVIAGDVNLGDYAAVVWILGEESTEDSTFNATEQALVGSYLDAGGKLFASGAETGWDLDQANNGRSFYQNLLHTQYVADDAATYNVGGAAGTIFDGLSFSFDNGAQFYNVEFPDVIQAAGFGGEQVVDNDAGAPNYTDSGSWTQSTGAGYNGGTYLFAPTGAAATARWEFSSPAAARGEVFVQYVAGSNRADMAHYRISTGTSDEVAIVDQKNDSLAWVSLGTYDFTAGTHAVELDAAASSGGSVVIADAVRVVLEDPSAMSADFDDDSDTDGADFLQWQRGVGLAAPVRSDGDADGDGAVDGDDLAIWESGFGRQAATTLVALNYVGGTGGGAAVQYDSGGSTKVVNFGFPFETITSASVRAAVMGRVLEFFELTPVSSASAGALSFSVAEEAASFTSAAARGSSGDVPVESFDGLATWRAGASGAARVEPASEHVEDSPPPGRQPSVGMPHPPARRVRAAADGDVPHARPAGSDPGHVVSEALDHWHERLGSDLVRR